MFRMRYHGSVHWSMFCEYGQYLSNQIAWC